MHAHLKFSWINHQTKQKDGTFFTYPPPIFPSPPHTLTSNSHNQTSPNKISPSLLFIIVILAVLFFISGLLHLLVRFLSKKNQPNTNPEPNAQNALQQLFHLHDSGLDQAFIDALPVFAYDEIVGPASEKEPFDCAVCLCEFSDKDTLRLLPACGHAFHMSCIDTWLLSNSTCPLCRGAVFDPAVGPVFEYDEFSESDARSGENGCGSAGKKSVEIEEEVVEVENVEKGVLTVRLGKFRKTDGGDDVGEIKEDESGSSKLGVDDRRCYSMGSYEYVVGDTNLRVALRRDRDKTKRDSGDDVDGRRIGIGSKNDSYSISKIWLWSKGGKIEGSSGEARPEDLSSPNLDLGWMPRREGV